MIFNKREILNCMLEPKDTNTALNWQSLYDLDN